MTYFTELFGAVGVATPFLFYAIGFIAVLITAVSKSGFGGAVALGIPVCLFWLRRHALRWPSHCLFC